MNLKKSLDEYEFYELSIIDSINWVLNIKDSIWWMNSKLFSQEFVASINYQSVWGSIVSNASWDSFDDPFEN